MAPATEISNEQGARKAFERILEYFLSPISGLLQDSSVSEIMINGHEQVWVERVGRIEATTCRFASERCLHAVANAIAQSMGRNIGTQNPILDGRLSDGSRVCVVLGDLAAGGTSINIRRAARICADADFLLRKGTLTKEMLAFLQQSVRAHQNILVSGGTGSGKTTLLSALCEMAENRERIVLIEDTRELHVRKPHVVQLETRQPDAFGRNGVSIRDLFVASLRMRPDRIIVGEVRRGEAMDMIQALTSGHRGSMATLHASTPEEACGRLETMALMSEIGLPLHALRRQIASAIDIIVQIERLGSGARAVTHISRISFEESSNCYQITDVCRSNQSQFEEK